jgi:DNA-binding transcriptional LysR family regulator
MPANLDALVGHRMVGFHSSATRALLPLEFTIDGVVRNVNLPALVTVNAAESLVAAGRLGLGLIQFPRYHIESDLERGMLVPVLPDFPPTPTPVSLLYPPNRQLSPRVRVFIDWLVHAFDVSLRQYMTPAPRELLTSLRYYSACALKTASAPSL